MNKEQIQQLAKGLPSMLIKVTPIDELPQSAKNFLGNIKHPVKKHYYHVAISNLIHLVGENCAHLYEEYADTFYTGALYQNAVIQLSQQQPYNPPTQPLKRLEGITDDDAIECLKIATYHPSFGGDLEAVLDSIDFEVIKIYDDHIAIAHNVSCFVGSLDIYFDGAIHMSDEEDEAISPVWHAHKVIDFLRSRGYLPNPHPIPVDNWIKVEDGLPPIDASTGNKIVKYVWVYENEQKKGVYFPEHWKTIDFEDWDDYSPESYPFTIEDKEKGCVWLKEGWYEQLYHPADDYYYYSPINPTHWQPLPNPPQQH